MGKLTKLTKPEQIWHLKPSRKDLETGANYASLTLPWTFNRMMMNTNPRGQNMRAFNIAKGIVAQEVLKRELLKRSVKPRVQRKSHRADDLFDFQVAFDKKTTRLDLKTMNHYNNYAGDERMPFSAEFLIENKSYPGPDWRKFFPMLIPHTQIGQTKEAYCYAIASSIDFRKNAVSDRSGFMLTAFPYGAHLPFFGSKRLILAREEVKKGFFVKIKFTKMSLLDADALAIRVRGEWMNGISDQDVKLKSGEQSKSIGPFSSINCFQLDEKYFENLAGYFEISISKNDFGFPVLTASKKNINIPEKSTLVIRKADFANLILPNSYELFFLGWTTKKEFLLNCRSYPAWIWPHDAINKFHNQLWSQITQRDVSMLTGIGFADAIVKKPSRINAGFLKTTGHGNGAACYVYPNTFGGGLRETNLYILPKDLNIMDELG